MDVVLYAALLAATVYALVSDGTGPVAVLGTEIGLIAPWKIAVVVGLLAVCGLRDKVIFLSARGEIYGALAVTFLLPGADMIVAAKLVMLGDLDRRRDFQAQQALSLRRLDDDGKQPTDPPEMVATLVLPALSR